ncbi:MAG TPA: hypothetical protein VIW64_12415 [Pyrinomonadaceae bacterium]
MRTESADNKRLGNFRQLVEIVSAEPDYNPSNPAITKAKLQTLITEWQAAVAEVGAKAAPYKVAVNERQTEFEDVPRRIGNSFRMAKASGASKKIQDDLTTSRRKLTGQRKSKLAKDDPNTAKDEAKKTHSVSQMSYDNQIGNARNYLALLSGIDSYAPNEEELKISSLQAFVSGLQAKNAAVNTAFVPLRTKSQVARLTLQVARTRRRLHERSGACTDEVAGCTTELADCTTELADSTDDSTTRTTDPLTCTAGCLARPAVSSRATRIVHASSPLVPTVCRSLTNLRSPEKTSRISCV